MAEYIKEKWSADFRTGPGRKSGPQKPWRIRWIMMCFFPQYLSEDPVVFNQQNRTVSQLVSNDARLYERISATAADINAHLTDQGPCQRHQRQCGQCIEAADRTEGSPGAV